MKLFLNRKRNGEVCFLYIKVDFEYYKVCIEIKYISVGVMVYLEKCLF